MTPISSLEAGAPLEGVYAVRRKERRLSRQGKPFLALTLADATGAVPAMVFDEADFFGDQFAEGDRVRVSGRVSERDGRRSVIISHLRARRRGVERPRTCCRAATATPTSCSASCCTWPTRWAIRACARCSAC